MAFRKYQKAEKVQPVSKKESAAIRNVVASSGKTSASQLTEDERKKLPKS